MNIRQIAETRYTTKAFDASRRLSDEQVEAMLEVLRLAPSSVNSQPWHFIVASTAEGKARLTVGTPEAYAYNKAKILNASHVVVLCGRNDFEDAHIQDILDHEQLAGRFATPEARAAQYNTRSYYANLHRSEKKDVVPWIEKQVYIALGSALFAAGALGIHACPIEGFDAELLDAELGLKDRGLHSVVLLALGFRSEDDFNGKLPKSRLPAERVFTRL